MVLAARLPPEEHQEEPKAPEPGPKLHELTTAPGSHSVLEVCVQEGPNNNNRLELSPKKSPGFGKNKTLRKVGARFLRAHAALKT